MEEDDEEDDNETVGHKSSPLRTEGGRATEMSKHEAEEHLDER